MLGVVVIYSIPLLRNIPLPKARALAKLRGRRSFAGLTYIPCLFFVIPLIAPGIGRTLSP